MEQDFRGNLHVNVTLFYVFFFGAVNWIVLILTWFEMMDPHGQLLAAQGQMT